MTVRELLQRIDSHEMAEWMAMYSIEYKQAVRDRLTQENQARAKQARAKRRFVMAEQGFVGNVKVKGDNTTVLIYSHRPC